MHFYFAADSLGLSASEEGELVIKALGACIWYLKQCLLDQQLLAMKKFEIYIPPNIPLSNNTESNELSYANLGRNMVKIKFLSKTV